MKLSCSFAFLVLFAISFILTACGPESQPATPTPQPAITKTPQASLTPTPTEIPMPAGSEELVSRLGESATVEINESGTFYLVYDNAVVGELNNEGQIMFQVAVEIISISTEGLEVLDGVLVAVNRDRTEEMGVD